MGVDVSETLQFRDGDVGYLSRVLHVLNIICERSRRRKI